MKFLNKSLVGVIASVLCVCNASADTQPCPAGCFCTNNGQYEPRGSGASYYENTCSNFSTHLVDAESVGVLDFCMMMPNMLTVILGTNVNWSDYSSDEPSATYYVDEFSELYDGVMGAYGFINGNFVGINTCAAAFGSPFIHDSIFLCPESHPYSVAGSNELTDCFKYKANGAKEYYGANNTVACNEGYYLPANSTQCAMCQPSLSHVCPGGSFEVTNQIQGLKVWCNPREYLPAGATQCSSCDDNVYSCAGGVYDFNPTEDQGRIKHNGYLDILHPTAANPNAQHKYSTCKPGYYRPAGSISCAECTGNYACPGGMFFDDVTYNVARGRILCGYGVPNANHSACVAQTTSPSKMKKKAENESNIETAKPAPSKKMDVVTKNTAGTLSRSLSQRPEAPSMNVTEPEVVNTKPVVSRSAKAVPQTNSVHESENVRERPDVRRPSRSHERGQR